MEARWFGGYLRNCFVVIVENVNRYPRFAACKRVERAGENRALNINSILSVIVGASITVFNEWLYCGASSISHSLFIVLEPCRIVLPL